MELPDGMTPHTLRHTFCTEMAKAGMNPKALQYIMGHKDIKMTLGYYAHMDGCTAAEEMRPSRRSKNAFYYWFYLHGDSRMRRIREDTGTSPKGEKAGNAPWNRASPAFGKLWEHVGKYRVDLS